MPAFAFDLVPRCHVIQRPPRQQLPSVQSSSTAEHSTTSKTDLRSLPASCVSSLVCKPILSSLHVRRSITLRAKKKHIRGAAASRNPLGNFHVPSLNPWILHHAYMQIPGAIPYTVCMGYCSAGVDKRVRSTSSYHCRQCTIVLKPCSDGIDYTVVCFMTHDCSCKL